MADVSTPVASRIPRSRVPDARPREVRPLEVEPLAPRWSDGETVRALVRYVAHTPVVALGGELDATAAIPAKLALGAALRTRPRFVVVDCAAVTGSDHTCVPLLTGMRRTAAWLGAELWLADLPVHVQDALDRRGLLVDFCVERTAVRAVDLIHLRAKARQSSSQPRTA
jgi:anti-anti-sigma regulatory factor